jgi:hypothetical protein
MSSRLKPCARSTTSTMIGVHASMEPRTDTRNGYRASAISSRLVNPSRSVTANPSWSSSGSTAIVATARGLSNAPVPRCAMVSRAAGLRVEMSTRRAWTSSMTSG